MHGRTLAAMIAVVTAVTAAAGASGSTGPAQIRITDVQSAYSYVPGANGRTGSLEIIRQRLYNPARSESSIGTAGLTCLYIDSRSRTCTGTYLLPKGQLVVTGQITSRLLYEIAIVGGTGLYDNARGSLTVTSTALRPKRRELLVFRLNG